MSKEYDIIKAVRDDLLKISTANQYAVNAKFVNIGYRILGDSGDFPQVYCYMGERKPLYKANSGMPASWKGDLWIHAQLKAGGITELVELTETWISELRKWLFQDSSITQDKWFTLGVTGLIAWGSQVVEDISVTPLWEHNICEVTFKINVEYSI